MSPSVGCPAGAPGDIHLAQGFWKSATRQARSRALVGYGGCRYLGPVPSPARPISVAQDHHILIITMERESKRNAIDEEMTALLDAALDRLDDDVDLRVGILTGTRLVFSAGTDLRNGSGDPTPRGGPYGVIRRRRRRPLIAAVEGPAFGGGFELVLACDLVVASDTALFGLPEVRRGTVATYGGLFRGPHALPLNVARELALAGRFLGAERAHQLGFVNELVPAGCALDAALRLAREICGNSPLSVQESKRVMDYVMYSDEELGWRITGEAREAIYRSEDMREGIAAFFEGRPPEWRGH